MKQLVAGTLRRWWLLLAKRAARGYVAGPALADAVAEGRWLSQTGFGCAIGYWNPEGTRPSQVSQEYLTALESLSKEKMDFYVSIKAPALAFGRELCDPVLQLARRYSIGIHFDSHGPETADNTFALIEEARQMHEQIGCTLPGRWQRSVEDADRAVDLGLRVRVVKGQWEEPGGSKRDLREGFLDVIDSLAGRARYVAVATHDSWLAGEALRRLRFADTPSGLELLFALPTRRPIQKAHAAGVGVRFYIPYGQPFLPYRLSELPRSPRILAWIAYDLLMGRYAQHPPIESGAS